MDTIPPGIVTFVSIRLSGPAGLSVEGSLTRRAKQDGGRVLEPAEETFFAASFTLVSSALAFARHVHEVLARDTMAGQTKTVPAIGIECGEVLPGANLKRLIPFDRSAELAELAYDGQNLMGPAAREVVRPNLPAGFGLIELGEIRLGVSITADKVSQLTISGFQVDFDRIEALDEVSSNIPEGPSDFIGRDAEAKAVRRALIDSRLVTIVGPAGVGKSSLAYWLSYDMVEDYRDGAWKVDLAKIPRGGSVATAIAADLKLPSMPNHTNEERVLTSLSTMNGLIWLDNCEHVIDQARDLLPKILKYCGAVTLLATSRTALRVDGEIAFELDPFAVPTNPDEYADSEAIRFFLSRAKKADPEFLPTPSELEIVAEICRGVDGLPLAIELVAAQAGKQPLETLLARISESLKNASVTTPSRHKTLNAALSWSYSLLNEKQQKFFRSLGVLAGQTHRDLAIAAGSSPQASEETSNEILQALVSASLIHESKSGATRVYRLLEPMRQFALDQLVRREEERAARLRFGKACLSWLLKLREAKVPEKRWIPIITREQANLYSVLQWLLDDPKGGPTALHICVELYDFWILKGPYDQAHTWYSKALERGKSVPGVDTADIYNWIGTFAGYAGRYEECKDALQKSVQLHRKSGNRHREAVALGNLGLHMRNFGELEGSIDVYLRAISIVARDDSRLALYLANLASHLEQLGRLEEARRYHREASELNEAADNAWIRALLEAQLAPLDLHENNTRSAELNLAKSLASYREVGNVQGLVAVIEFAGFLALRLGNVERAAKLIGGSAKIFLAHGVGRPPVDELKKNEALSEIEGALGSEQAEALYIEGAMLTLDELYDYARAGVGGG